MVGGGASSFDVAAEKDMPVIGGDTIYVGPLWLVFRGCFCLFLHLIVSEGKSVRLGLSIVIINVSSRVDACVLIL